MTQTKLLIATNEYLMGGPSLDQFTIKMQAIADKIGAELVVLGPGQHAQLFDARVLAEKSTAGEIKSALRGAAQDIETKGTVTAIQGEAMCFALDPLEQAIESTVRMLRDEHQQMAETGAKQDIALCDRLGTHLDALLAEQLNRVSGDGVQADDEVSEQIAALQQSVRVIHGRQDRVFLATGIEGA